VNHPPLRSALTVLALFGTGVTAGAGVGVLAIDRAQDPYIPIETAVRVLSTIEHHWYRPTETDELATDAIEGMMDGLDRHSRWMSKDTLARLTGEARGTPSTLGIELTRKGDQLIIAQVQEGSAADRLGLEPGAQLQALNGSTDPDEILEKLDGPLGGSVELKVMAEGTVQTLETAYDRVHKPSVLGERQGTIGYLLIRQFQDGTTREIQAKLRDFGTIDGLIVDLRDNPGGLLSEAISVADIFLSPGNVVSTASRDESDEIYKATRPQDFSGPMVTLINGRSASGAELLAAALQDRQRATLVGTRSYGKTTIQTVYELPDGSALKLTTGEYIPPRGEPVHDGIIPDIELAWTNRGPKERLAEALAELPAEQAAQALVWLNELSPEPTAKDITPEEARPLSDRADDPQLQRAFDLLR